VKSLVLKIELKSSGGLLRLALRQPKGTAWLAETLGFLDQRWAKVLRKSHLREEAGKMKLVVEVEDLDLEAFLDQLAKKEFADNDLVRELILAANAQTDEAAKRELIAFLLKWASQNDLPASLLEVVKREKPDLGKNIDRMKLKIGSVELEDFSD